MPDDEANREYYETHYYASIRSGANAKWVGLKLLLGSGEQAERERAWLRATLWADICYVLNRFAPGKRVLDVGCGTGELVAHLAETGFEPLGIDPSVEAVAFAEAHDRRVCCIALEELATCERFDAITLLNVLEHVTKPVDMLERCKGLLRPGGLICIRVPNDFSEIQVAAHSHLNKGAPWIVPDHVSYFDFRSLRALLEHVRLDVVYSQGDFPMELFLLMGDDYIDAPDVGSECHERRRRFELALPGPLRRKLYRALGGAGVGRNCLVVGRH